MLSVPAPDGRRNGGSVPNQTSRLDHVGRAGLGEAHRCEKYVKVR